jgi:Glycosyl hydrolases family 39
VSEALPPPAGLRAVPGRGHVMLDWEPVPGAAGYLVHRAARAAGPYQPLDHGGGDVLAVPAGPYADTTGDGHVAYYAVAAVADGQSAGPLSAPAAAAPDPAGSGAVTVEVGDEVTGELARPWQAMIGSEHLSYLMRQDRTGGRVIGTELRQALRIARDELGVRAVRAHGILCRVGALSHWVASDHFEELGAPPELFHGGFGLLSVGNLRKPRYWALALLAGMGRHRLGVEVSGDGAGGLVEALAARHEDGRTGILVWNGTLDQGKMAGDARLDREVRLRVRVSPGTPYTARHYRIDAGHSNIVTAWEKLRDGAGGPDRAAWPRDGQWRTLREMNALGELGPPARVTAGNGLLELAFELPMPGVSYLELVP